MVIAGWQLRLPAEPLLIAPMMDLDACLLSSLPSTEKQLDWQKLCTGPKASASHLVESTLQRLQPRQHSQALGYTLKVPLLALLQPNQNDWRVNMEAIDKVARTISDNPRPLILYLFSTHFGTNAPIEPVLAQNPDNLGHTANGPLQVDNYYGQPIYPWTVARTDNAITHYRSKVIKALTERLCLLPANTLSKIRGVTMLGEVHQLFPHFETGMGFDSPYSVTDYSESSVLGFRQYLQTRYPSIGALNQRHGSGYVSFKDIKPPSKDVRTQALQRFEEHIDAYAAGQLPISGWAYINNHSVHTPTVKIFLNGKLTAEVPVHLSRQDVRVAHPEFKSADVGWRHDLDFSQMATGVHRIDLALAQQGQPLLYLGTRTVSVMSRQQTAPEVIEATAVPAIGGLPDGISASIDEPQNQASYYFNPLAREWLVFRNAQVVSYLNHFNGLLNQSCFADTPHYTHQIVPQFNPSWDSGKYATTASLQPTKRWHTGISLYGESSYGTSVSNWLKLSSHGRYGVTEFHPLIAMGPERLATIINQHHHQGAAFLSFFLETRWQLERVTAAPNLFSFDPDNQQFGSDQLYESMKLLLSKP